MKTRLTTTLLLAAACTLPAMAEDTTTTSNDSALKIKALEAELSALRAQLQATSQVRGEDRDRAEVATTSSDIQIDIQGDFETGMDHAPDFVREMIMERMAGRGEPMSIMINGQEMIVGDMPGDRNRSEHHQVMQFDLGDMTDGGMDGEIHIEITGDRDMGHLAESIPHMVIATMMEGDRRMDRGDDIRDEIMRRMERHDLPMDLLEQVMEEHEVHNEHDVVIGMDMLIERLEREGHDPGPIMELRHGFMERLEGGPRHDRPEDPFFREGGEFVGKMRMTNEIAGELSDRINVAIFCVWEARQHLEPQERLDVLFPIMIDEDVDMAVRNAAAMVVREAFVQLGDREQALETLGTQIRLNGTFR